jgi:hypothetical protein
MSNGNDVFTVLEECRTALKVAERTEKCQARQKAQDAIFNLQEACKNALTANIDGDYEDYRQLYAINILVDNLVDSLYN